MLMTIVDAGSCDRQGMNEPQGGSIGSPSGRNTGTSCLAGVDDNSPCPSCQERGLWRESVDVGVGTIYGPYGCECGWSEDRHYDRRHGPAEADADYAEHACDQWGMGHRVGPRAHHRTEGGR